MSENIQDSPGSKALTAMRELHADIVFKKPSGLPKRRNRQKILDEESYIEVSSFVITFMNFWLNYCCF